MCRRPEANWSQELSFQFQLVNFQGPGASTLSEQSSLFWQFSASGHQFIHCFVWLPTDEEVSSSNISVPHASFIYVSTSLPGRMVHTCCVLSVGGRWQDLRGLPLQPTLRKELHGRSVGGKGRSRALRVCICVLGPPFTPPQTLSLRVVQPRR